MSAAESVRARGLVLHSQDGHWLARTCNGWEHCPSSAVAYLLAEAHAQARAADPGEVG